MGSIFHVSFGGVELQKPRENIASKLRQIPLRLIFHIIHVYGDPAIGIGAAKPHHGDGLRGNPNAG